METRYNGRNHPDTKKVAPWRRPFQMLLAAISRTKTLDVRTLENISIVVLLMWLGHG